MDNLTGLTLGETINGVKAKKFSVEEVNRAYLERIKKIDDKLNAYLWVNENSDGIPAAIKDLISTKGITTTAGSKILENYAPPYNATVVGKLLENGISVIGKTNLDEFAMGSSGENSAYGATKNPWNTLKVPGGSSSGSAAAVAADLCVFALGTDTGGSVRQPASLCGVVGLKPSYGRASRYGLIAMASSLDTPGVLTKSVNDARLVLDWISGPDGYDSNCSNSKFQISKDKFQIKGIRIGVPNEYFKEGLDRQVESVVRGAIKKLEELGATIVDVELPHTQYAISTYYIIMASEVSSNLSRFDGIRFGKSREKFGEEVKRRIMLGTYALSAGYYEAYYGKAQRMRRLIRDDFRRAFESVDILVGPTAPTPAFGFGERTNNPLEMYLADIYTVAINLAGVPALSIPCAIVKRDGKDLPVGLQIIGKWFDESAILSAAYTFEQSQ